MKKLFFALALVFTASFVGCKNTKVESNEAVVDSTVVDSVVTDSVVADSAVADTVEVPAE